MSDPKPGDPAFIPRYPPLPIGAIRQRIAERRAMAVGHTSRAILDGDTEIMETLLNAVVSLRFAVNVAQGRALTDDPYAEEHTEPHPLLTPCSGGCGGGRVTETAWICDACRPREPVAEPVEEFDDVPFR